jgi:hypothetical protein
MEKYNLKIFEKAELNEITAFQCKTCLGEIVRCEECQHVPESDEEIIYCAGGMHLCKDCYNEEKSQQGKETSQGKGD